MRERSAMKQFQPLRWPQYYYASTVAFALLDWLAGANVRAAGLADYPGMRIAYYALCVICALVVRLAPPWSAPVTLAESTVNIVMLILSVLMPLYTFDEETAPALSAAYPQIVANFLIAGTAATVAFYQSLYALPRTR